MDQESRPLNIAVAQGFISNSGQNWLPGEEDKNRARIYDTSPEYPPSRLSMFRALARSARSS